MADDPQTIFDNTEAAWEALKGPYGTPNFDFETMKSALSQRTPLVTDVSAEWSLQSQTQSHRQSGVAKSQSHSKSEVAKRGMADCDSRCQFDESVFPTSR